MSSRMPRLLKKYNISIFFICILMWFFASSPFFTQATRAVPRESLKGKRRDVQTSAAPSEVPCEYMHN